MYFILFLHFYHLRNNKESFIATKIKENFINNKNCEENTQYIFFILFLNIIKMASFASITKRACPIVGRICDKMGLIKS